MAKFLIKKKKYSFFDLGTKIVFNGGPKDGSVNHDRYYYEFEDNKRFKKVKKAGFRV